MDHREITASSAIFRLFGPTALRLFASALLSLISQNPNCLCLAQDNKVDSRQPSQKQPTQPATTSQKQPAKPPQPSQKQPPQPPHKRPPQPDNAYALASKILSTNLDLVALEPAKALAVFDAALKRYPNELPLLFGKAKALVHLNQLGQAQKVYEHILKIEPQSVGARIGLADSLRLSSRTDEKVRSASRKLLDEAAAMAPNDPSLHSTLSLWYTDAGRWREGLAEIDRCMALLGKPEPGHFAHRGNIYRAMKQPKAALQDFDRAVKGLPSASHYYLRGSSYMDMKQDKLAESDLRQAMKLDSKLWDAPNLLGLVLARNGKPKEAIELFDKAIKANPSVVYPHIHKANCLRDLRRFSDAAATWHEIEKRFTFDKDCYYNRAHLHLQTGKYQAALDDLNKAIELDAGEGHYFHMRGQLYKDHFRSPDKALEDFEKATHCLFPKAEFFNSLSSLLIDTGQYNEAYIAASRALKLDSKDTYAYQLRGLAELKLGDFKGAAADFAKILAVKPNDAWTFELRGEALMGSHLYRQAEQSLSRSIALTPGVFQKYNKRAACWLNLREFNKAIADYTTSLTLHPSNQAFIDRGKACSQAGLNDRAISDFTRAIEMDPYFAIGYIERAKIYDRIGKTDLARKDRTEADKRGYQDLMGK